MEIDEFLTRISLSGADPTIFTLYEKGKNISATGKELFFDNRTLKTYTKAEDSASMFFKPSGSIAKMVLGKGFSYLIIPTTLASSAFV